MQTLSSAQIGEAGLDDWRKLAQALHTRFTIPDYPAGAAFVSAVADAAEAANHHPDVTLRYGHVDISLCTHDAGHWVTSKDVELARTISAIAREHGLVARPALVAQLELALDTAEAGALAPFWSALLTGTADNVVRGEVLEPTGRVPVLWFQPTDPHRTPAQRWHIDLWLAPEAADERIAAAVAAGGTVVDDTAAPSFTVLADPDGNKVCVCTDLDRG